MFKRSVVLLCALLALVIPVAPARAQDAPDAINDALADLSARVGRTVTLADLDNWQWSQANYGDTSLGCPQPDQMYLQVITNGYRFLFTYSGATYDYRVSANRAILVLCSSPAAITAPTTTATVTPTLPQTTPAGRAVCSGAMLTRLEAGIRAQASDNNIPKNIRSAPTSDAARVGQVPPGATVTVLDGPQCADGMVWWQIDYDTLVGWVSEGQYGVYWFAPLPAAPALTFTPLPPPGTPAPPQFYGMPENPQIISPLNATHLMPVLDLSTGEVINALAWSPDGTVLAAAGQRGTWLYSIAAFTLPPRLLQVPGGSTFAVAFSPDQITMASAHQDATVRLWDIGTGGQRAVLRGHTAPVRAVACGLDGLLFASGDEDGAIILWDAAEETPIAALSGHDGAITGLAFSPDGTLLASSSADGSARLWDVVSATLASVLPDSETPENAVAFSPDGARIVTAGEDGIVRVRDITTGNTVALEGHTGPALALAFSPDGSILASAGGPPGAPLDPGVWLWDSATGQTAAVFTRDDVRSVVFSPDGTVLAWAAIQGEQSTIHLLSPVTSPATR